jgi:hypothetical protein
MHRWIVALYNAVLVEEVKEIADSLSGINLNNTVLSDNILNSNIDKTLNHSRNRFAFSEWFFSCPLLLAFLNPDSQVYRRILKLSKFSSNVHHDELNVYTLLVKVKVSDVKQKTAPRVRKGGYSSFDDVLEEFKRNKIPTSLLARTKDKKISQRRNSQIREAISKHLPDKKWDASRIWRFRKYVQTNRIKW